MAKECDGGPAGARAAEELDAGFREENDETKSEVEMSGALMEALPPPLCAPRLLALPWLAVVPPTLLLLELELLVLELLLLLLLLEERTDTSASALPLEQIPTSVPPGC